MSRLENTAVDAWYSKQSATSKGYLPNPMVSFDVNNTKTKSKSSTPLLHHIYSSRVKVVHKLVSCGFHAISRLNCGTVKRPQLLVLGIGLDTSFESYDADIFGVDLPDVIRRRTTSNIPNPNLKLLEGDLNNISLVMSGLQAMNFVSSAPTIVVIECVMGYLSQTTTVALLRYLSMHLPQCISIIYDPIVPLCTNGVNGFTDMFRNGFTDAGAPLLSSSDSLISFSNRFRDCGWPHVNCVSMTEAIASMLPNENLGMPVTMPMTRSSTMEAFDEYAALAQLNDMYGIAIISTDTALFSMMMQLIFNNPNINNNNNNNNNNTNIILDTLTTTGNVISFSDRTSDVIDDSKPSSSSSSSLSSVSTFIRVRALQRRLQSLEDLLIITQRNNRSKSNVNVNFSIRRASSSDMNKVADLMSTGFEDVSRKYSAVRRYLKRNLKEIAEYSGTSDDLVMWVAVSLSPGGTGGGDGHRCQQLLSSILSSTASCTDGDIVACGGFRTKGEETGVGRLVYMSVDPDHRRHGLGSAILKQVLSHCRSRDIHNVVLSTLKDLKSARSLYKKFGFIDVGCDALGDGCEVCEMLLRIQT
eukprot:gene4910-9791_t